MEQEEVARGVVSDTENPQAELEELHHEQHVHSAPGGPAHGNQFQMDPSFLPPPGAIPPSNPHHHNMMGAMMPYAPVPPPQPPGGQHILQFYEARMRDHAAAYASAAAGAAWAAAQIAADVAHATSTTNTAAAAVEQHTAGHLPRTLPVPPVGPPIAPTFPQMMPSPYVAAGPHPQGPGFLDPSAAMMGQGMHMYPPDMHVPPTHGGLEAPNGTSSGMDTGHQSSSHYGHRRRKRQQQMPPSNNGGASAGDASTEVAPPPHGRRGRRRRARANSAASSGSGDPSHYPNQQNHQQQQQQQHARASQQQPAFHGNPNHRRARIRKMIFSSNSSESGGSGAPTYFSKKKKARQPNDDSLLGKTGVSALYEWCGKRRTTPTFTLQSQDTESLANAAASSSSDHGDLVASEEEERRRKSGSIQEDFEMAVSIDGMEWGRGRGRTKAAAKQEAARRSLEALLPGVIFEETSGILVYLPSGNGSLGSHLASKGIRDEANQWKAMTTLDDLAPNLAKRLAIAADDPSSTAQAPSTSSSKKRPPKWNSVYPEASTTSEEEDENTYYASRGASVCSALLHAMVQIDDRIPEAPSYVFEVATVSAEGEIVQDGDKFHQQSMLSHSFTSRDVALPVHRGPFTCTASIRLKKVLKDQHTGEPTKIYDLLQATGTAGTKREARHTASAKLLALLFPECDGMAQVKQAAEAAREKYAASKALKLQNRRERSFTSRPSDWNQVTQSSPNVLSFAAPTKSSPILPAAVESKLLACLGINDEDDASVAAKESRLTLQASRQKQLDELISSSLQKLNDRDEEGRSLPDELTVDDVGRTLLRRATPEDHENVRKLLEEFSESRMPASGHALLVDGDRFEEEAPTGCSPESKLYMGSSHAIVLLLCRAIAPYDDPPLGCAVLTLGFTMGKGRVLRIAQLRSKPHLPRERFIECLQKFSRCMGCEFESVIPEDEEDGGPRRGNSKAQALGASLSALGVSHVHNLIQAHLPSAAALFEGETSNDIDHDNGVASLPPHVHLASPLQSVLEGNEEVEESGAESSPEKRLAKKNQDKPSKRSRVN